MHNSLLIIILNAFTAFKRVSVYYKLFKELNKHVRNCGLCVFFKDL